MLGRKVAGVKRREGDEQGEDVEAGGVQAFEAV
jgi:hypothetical protein